VNLIKKEKALQKLYNKIAPKYKRLITHFGNLNSEIMILGLEPGIKHYRGKSKSIFRFDFDLILTTGRKSSGVILKVFDKLGLNINDYFWNNLYLVPKEINKTRQAFKRLLINEIDIIRPKIILCLGKIVFDTVNDIDLRIKVIRISHPAYVLYGYPLKSYINEWKEVMRKIGE